jgi:hypothetical protein
VKKTPSIDGDSSAGVPLAELVHSARQEEFECAAKSEELTEDLALALLKRTDLTATALELLAKNAAVMKHRRVLVGIVSHAKTARQVSLPMARRLYTFELMRIVLLPAVPADLKLAIEQTIVSRLETVSAGERLALAKQGSTRTAAALLFDGEARVMKAALDNPRLTEVFVVRAVMREGASASVIQAVCGHSRWSLRREVQMALLRNEHTPMAKALQFARGFPVGTLKEVLRDSRLSERIKRYLMAELKRREG